ncbi:MAG: N-acylglucosamine 2-epimerase (GlcNAc 2-epimerase) [candidate division BRC1 bacterium ADurb.BinA364]|nr:MAG: N-acylglucosamine 2-epimerase (GlcNAc 2-epimerase) [candidate division BRC1 bacterium ADurb.BinA364]
MRDAGEGGKIVNDAKGVWEQNETVRTLAHYAMRRGRRDLWAPLAGMVEFQNRFLIDPEHGGFYTLLNRDGSVRNDMKGFGMKTDYHAVGMCEEIMQLESMSAGAQKA